MKKSSPGTNVIEKNTKLTELVLHMWKEVEGVNGRKKNRIIFLNFKNNYK